MNDLLKLTSVQQREGLVSGQFMAVDLVTAYLDSIKHKDNGLNAYLHVNDKAFEAAELLDNKIAGKQRVGSLAGVCVGVKDCILTKGMVTTAGSKILERFLPNYDATVVKKLIDEDAIIIGKTNMDEFAMGSSTEYSAYGPSRNPYDPERVPGGSSGGSAVAVAASEASCSLGSDTGGSIRQPGFMCGVYALKPTYGLVSRYGLIAFASSLDQIGPIARDIGDIRLLFDVIRGYDPFDSTSVDREVQGDERDNWTVGVIKGLDRLGVDKQIMDKFDETRRMLQKNGVGFVDVELPNMDYGIESYYIIACAEASSNLARYDGVHYTVRAEASGIDEVYFRTRDKYFGPEVKRRIMLGTFVLAKGYYDAYYLRALKVRRLIKNDFDREFNKCNLIMMPTSPILPFKLGERTDDPIKMYLCDYFTIPANLVGLPGINVPVGTSSEGLPIGVQFMAPAFHDLQLINFCSKYF